MMKEVPRFERRREGSFRAWLRRVTTNAVRGHLRRRRRRPDLLGDPLEAFLDDLARPDGELAREWDLEHDRHVFRRMMSAVGPHFEATTWEAFRRFAVDGLPAARVAGDLGVSVNSVILAKSRVLKRLREEAGNLLR